MKKTVLLIITLLLILINNSKIKALVDSRALGDGVKNVYLNFVFKDNLNKSINEYEDFLSLINYVDSNYELQNSAFMDTFLFLPATDNQGFKLFSEFSTDEWNSYLEKEKDLFGLLNSAVDYVNNKFSTNKKVNVILAVPYGYGAKSIDTLVNEQKEKFGTSYENLNLIGFYWYQEKITPDMIDTVKGFNAYVHQMNNSYKTLWIPYTSQAFRDALEVTTEGEKISDYGFDFISLQSSYYYGPRSGVYSTDDGRLDYINSTASSNGFGVEIELDYVSITEENNFNRYREYLKYGVNNLWNNSINVYYAPWLNRFASFALNGNLAKLNNSNLIARDTYELTYKYAKQKLKTSDIYLNFTSGYDFRGYNNVALGKNYTTSTLYTDSTVNLEYVNVSGTELTDGIYGENDYGTEWIGFNKNVLDIEHSVTIDLAEIYNGINGVTVEFYENSTGSVGFPNKVSVYYSLDSKTFTKLGDCSYTTVNRYNRILAVLKANPVEARYIKIVMDKGTQSFVFVSEVLVNNVDVVSLEADSGIALAGGEALQVRITNKSNGNLTVASSDDTVATAYISNGVLYISPLAVGEANIEITEDVNNSKAVYKIYVEENNGDSIDVIVPDTFSSKSALLITISMMFVFVGIGFIIHSKKSITKI